jgi:addiction module RelB/DinJ family antitoxin
MKTLVNIKVDTDVKQDAQKLAKSLGISLSTILNAHLRQFVRDKAVTFSTVPKMTPELEKILTEVNGDIKKKRNVSKTISNKKELETYFSAL